jgi:uncharacterized protein (TIGR02284 family)
MHNIETLNKLLKDELAATETYQQALDKFRKDVLIAEAEDLLPVYEGHKQAVSSLQAQIRQLGGAPSEGSGVWGSWAEMIMEGANVLGKQAVLTVLQKGEKSGEEDYKDALQNSKLPSDVRSLIEAKLLPAQQSHIRILNRLLGAATA